MLMQSRLLNSHILHLQISHRSTTQLLTMMMLMSTRRFITMMHSQMTINLKFHALNVSDISIHTRSSNIISNWITMISSVFWCQKHIQINVFLTQLITSLYSFISSIAHSISHSFLQLQHIFICIKNTLKFSLFEHIMFLLTLMTTTRS